YHPSTFTRATSVGYGAGGPLVPRRRTSPGRAASAEPATVRRGSRSRGTTATRAGIAPLPRGAAVGPPYRSTRPHPPRGPHGSGREPRRSPLGGVLEGVASLGVAPQVAHPRHARGRHTHSRAGHGRPHLRGPVVADGRRRPGGRREAQPRRGR